MSPSVPRSYQDSAVQTACTHIDVNDERTAELLEKACKKSHIPVDMKKVTRADGSITHTAFCEVKSIDQMAALLKMASEQVLEEQKEMTKTLVLYDDKGKEVMSADFVNNGEINMDDVETLSKFSTRFEIKDHKNEVLLHFYLNFWTTCPKAAFLFFSLKRQKKSIHAFTHKCSNAVFL